MYHYQANEAEISGQEEQLLTAIQKVHELARRHDNGEEHPYLSNPSKVHVAYFAPATDDLTGHVVLSLPNPSIRAFQRITRWLEKGYTLCLLIDDTAGNPVWREKE